MSRARGAVVLLVALVLVAATAGAAAGVTWWLSGTGSAARAGIAGQAAAQAARAAGRVPKRAHHRAAASAIGGTQLASPGLVVNYPAGDHRKLPKVPASAYVIADAGTGQVLAARDPHGRFAPASTLKVLTAISLIPRLNPSAMITASKRATSVEPNIAGLVRGRKYQVSSLFKALLLISANDRPTTWWPSSPTGCPRPARWSRPTTRR
jgi:D-alanyl-D-alanine carboxypeptidase